MGRIGKILSFVRSKVGEAFVTDVKADPDAGANVTVQHFMPIGDDSFPLLTDLVYFAPSTGKGRGIAIAYLDPKNEAVAEAGDKRTYARNANGLPVTQIHQKNDGSILVSNDNGSFLLRPDGGSIITTPASTIDCTSDGNIKLSNGSGNFELSSSGSIKGDNIGSFELQASGIFEVNGVTIDLAGNITTPTTVTAIAVTSTSVAASSSMSVAGKEMNNHTHIGSPTAPNGPQSNTGAPS